MEQRPLRLGDIVDDYCPRERRITNHAIVAIVGQSVRQTRCTTCDAEHIYKEAKVPRRRKESGDDRAGDSTPGQLVAPQAEMTAAAPAPPPVAPPPMAAAAPVPPKSVADPGVPDESGDAADAGTDTHVDGWHSHRRLIRATLPRTENEQPPPRPIPEFTMHQRQGRGGPRHGGGGGHWHTRGSNGGSNGEINGNVGSRNGFRHGRHGQGPPGQGGGQGPNGGPGGHGDQGPGGQGAGRPGRKNRHRRGHKRPR
jgi:hypothetical protein